ncbi:LuxR family transcriptional regulator [Streptomyces sp. XD-27]|uniref:helix-turn-helix transcriptional regulator n=1 Tax=Streptomyces sp. XD-27 TaxID=3062779 RepID=UPI0026F44A95|nr:LuxR family transcriptional regulator [Streptomyces sp. XD-27]WKX69945.1 AAA family ATPase [Streptomyces sp. XD-27]
MERDLPDGVVGRAGLLARARGLLARGGGLLLPGPAGIGKSTVLASLAADYAAQGHLLLRCSPTESESQLPFLALIDALGPVVAEVSGDLPAAQHAVLDAALTGRAGGVAQHDGLALRLAVLSVFRALAARTPVALVADDLQWMDEPSAELLAFVARRVGELPVLVIGAVRTATAGEPWGRDSAARDRDGEAGGHDGTAWALGGGAGHRDGAAWHRDSAAFHRDGADGLGRALRVLPPPARVLPVPPLSPGQVTELLRRRRRSALPGAVLREIHRASGGNPLFALELGRALAERDTPPRPGDPLPVPTSLRSLVLDRLRALPAEARRTLLIAAAGARPGLALLRAAGRPDAEAELAAASALGIAGTGDDLTVRFAHPLISAALYAEADPYDRRAAHTALARASTDPIERARHLALATPGPDEQVAATLARAAAVARERGAPGAAARLGLFAAERTPAYDTAAATGRRLDAAEDALVAGEPELARQTAQEVLAEAARPADRVRAWIAVIDSAGQAMADVDDVFPQALADAGDDPRLLAPLRYQLAWHALLAGGSPPRARTEAARAAALAAQAADRRTELLALSLQALTEAVTGHEDADRTLAAALAEPQDPRVACDHNGPVAVRFRLLLMSDRLEEARAAIGSLVRLAARRGAVESQLLFLRGLAETELRAGRCAVALAHAHDSLRLARDAGVGEGPVLHLAALAEAAGGSVPRALALAQEAVHSAEEDGDLIYLARALAALGHARLTGGDAQGAVAALRRVRDMERGQGVTDPARGRWHGDLAEALVRVGELAEARELVAGTRAAATRLRRAGVLAVLNRAEGLVRAGYGDLDGAAERLRTAARELGALGYRVEEGRARLALAVVESRRGAAAASAAGYEASAAAYEEAARIFRRAKARPWLDQASAARAHLADMCRAPGPGPEPGPGPDRCRTPGPDAALDVGRDSGPDAGRDPGPYSGLGAGSDSGLGAGSDSGLGAGPDSRLGAGAAPTPRTLDVLAAMERRVAALVLEGATNREIAERLFISVKTVEATLTRVYRKLGIRSRVDIVRLASRGGE